MRRVRDRGPSYFVVGLVTLIAAAIVTFFGFTKEIPFQDRFEIKAAFRSANNIRLDSPVRVAGVNIGKVTGVDKIPGRGDVPRDGAIVTLQIDDEDTPIHADAKVTIRPRIFLEGNFFVDVAPGSPSAPVLEDEDTIPMQNTATPVQLDQVLGALQTDTRENLKILLKEYASSLEGEGGKGFNRSIKYWEPAYKNSAIVNQATLGLIEGDLRGYIKGAGAFAEAAGAQPEQLKRLITDFNLTANAFAREDQNLEATVAEVPRTLRAAQPALNALNEAFPPVRRLISDLRPAVRSSGPAIDAALPFIRQARALVSRPELRGLTADLRPTVPSLAGLQKGTIPLFELVREASSCQNEVILPWTRDKIDDPNFPAKGRVFEEAPKFLPGIAGESRSGDANGQWFRVLATGGNFTVAYGNGVFAQTYAPLQGTNPPKPTSRPPIRPDVPCENQQQPDLRTQVGNAPRSFRNEVDTPSEREGYAKYEGDAIGWLKDQIKIEGLEKILSVGKAKADGGEAPGLDLPGAAESVLSGLTGTGSAEVAK